MITYEGITCQLKLLEKMTKKSILWEFLVGFDFQVKLFNSFSTKSHKVLNSLMG